MSASRLSVVSRRPRRVSITIADCTYQSLLSLSDDQGRSLSNLSSYLLEQAVERVLRDQRAPSAPSIRPLPPLSRL